MREPAPAMLPPHPHVRWSLVVPQAFPGVSTGELREIAAGAAKLGFGAIEASAPMGTDRFDDALAGNVTVVLAGLPLLRAGVSLSSEGEDQRTAIGLVDRAIEQAEAVGAQAVMVTSGAEPDMARRAAAWERLVDAVIALGARAERRGVRIRLEPTDTEMTHRQMLGATSAAIDAVERVRSAGVRVDINLDTSHLLQLGEDIAGSLAAARASCAHIHLANCILRPRDHPLLGDRHPPFGHPGSEVDESELARYLLAVDRCGYLDGPDPVTLGIEVIPLDGDGAWATLRRAVGSVADAWLSSGLRADAP